MSVTSATTSLSSNVSSHVSSDALRGHGSDEGPVELRDPPALPVRIDAFEGRVVSESARNRAVVDDFYRAFERKDGAAMTAAYAPSASFSDPVFPSLKNGEPGAMWRMLCKSEDLKLRHEIVKADGDTVVARWVANYTFAGRDIENHVTATIKLKDGKIVSHTDQFDMSRWLEQAYGMATYLPFAEHILGGVTRHVAKNRLESFIAGGG